MAGFPILRLPLVPQLAVLDNVDNKDLFALSLISERSKNLVQAANRSIRDVDVEFRREKEVYITERHIFLMTLKETEGQSTFQGVGNMTISLVNPDREWILKNASLLPRQYLLHLSDSVTSLCYETGKYREMESRVIRHFFAVFKKVEKLTVTLKDAERVHTHVIWDFTKNFHALFCSIDNRKLAPEEASFLFEELTVSDTFSISAPMEGFEIPNGFAHKEVTFELPQCPIDAIMTLRSETIRIICPLFPPAEVNRLLKAWIARESLENLKSLTIRSNERITFDQMDETLQGIPVNSRNYATINRVDGRQASADFTDGTFDFQVFF